MSKYIDEECMDCSEYIVPYGCSWHSCPLYQEWEIGRSEMAADNEHDRRKENRIHPIFDEVLKPFMGGNK